MRYPLIMGRLALVAKLRDSAEALSALKRRAAAASVAASLVLAVVKLAAGFASGSLALLSEGAHNALDIGASALTLFTVREADKPPDADHQFGHAKIEAVAALAQTGFLAALSIGVAVQAIERIWAGNAVVDVNAFAVGVVVFSLVVDLVRWRGLTRVARLTSSHALAADALHFSSDLISSVLVLLGLAAVRAGYPHADALAALGVAGFIAVAGYRLGRETIDALVDRAPEGLTEAMRALVAETPGVARTEAIRLRTSGPRTVGEVIVSAPRTLLLERVAAIKSELAARIGQRWPQADLTITANPIALDDETILERVLAGRDAPPAAGASCHHPGHGRPQERRARSRGRRRYDLGRRPFRRFRPRKGDRRPKSARTSRSKPTSSPPNPRLAARPPIPISHAASRPSSPAPSASRSAFWTSTRCECARHLAASLCCSIAALIRQRQSKPFTPPSTRWSARCARRFRRFAARSDMRSHQAEARRKRDGAKERHARSTPSQGPT